MKGSENKALNYQGYSLKDSQLFIEKIPAAEIARKAGTPVYVYSENQLLKNMEEFTSNFKDSTGGLSTRVLYASKAFDTIAMLELVKQAGLGLDVVSAGELYTAIQADFPMDKVVFHGNAKSTSELVMALENHVGTIVLDNLHEARKLKRLTETMFEEGSLDKDLSISVLLRVNPGVEAHTHAYIVTAHVDSKFGVLCSDLDTILQISELFNQDDFPVHFDGFHAHIGSQIFDPEAFKAEIDVMCKFIVEFEKCSSMKVRTLDLGGGFAAWYTPDDQPIPIDLVCKTILESIHQAQKENSLQLKNLWIEPGRSITANAACTLYRVESVKHTPNKTYVFVDGGMNDNIRPALYDADYNCDLAQRMDEEKSEKVTVAGKCCESGDIIVKEDYLPAAMPDDLLAVYTTGAYGYSMASHYNKLGVPPVVFVKDDQARIVVKRESLEDLIKNEVDERLI